MSQPDHAAVDPASRLAGLALAAPAAAAGWVPQRPADLAAAADAVGSPPVAASADLAAPAFPTAPGPATDDRLPTAWFERLPPWLQGVVATPSAAALGWLAAVCVVCLAVTAYVVLHGRDAPAERGFSAPLPAAGAPVSAVTAPGSAPTGSVVVDVGGRVRHPGLVTLPAGARVADAVRAAGGALHRRDLMTVNLAARVTDGQLLLIGLPGGATASGAPGGSSPPVDLNTATADQLDALPGIGPVLAQRIIDWRTAHGGFHQVGDLREVSGIGDSIYADLAPLVSV